MRYLIKHDKKKELLIISMIYFLAHGFLLIASGRWWDDWCVFEQPFWTLKNFAMEMGRPSFIIEMTLAKILPESGYRIITFFMYFGCCFFLYRVLKEWLSISDSACFEISALYAVIPANDSRMLLCIFPNTVSTFFFMGGICWLAIALNKESITWRDRLICYCCFIIAFTTNSVLVLYGVVLLMILTKKIKKEHFKGLLRYSDFLLLPICFFAVKTKFFPSYGGYAEYNRIRFSSIVYAITNVLRADCRMIKNLLLNFIPNSRIVLFCCV